MLCFERASRSRAKTGDSLPAMPGFLESVDLTLVLVLGCCLQTWPGWGGVANGLRWGTDVRRRGKYSSLRTGSYRAVRRVAYATRVVLDSPPPRDGLGISREDLSLRSFVP